MPTAPLLLDLSHTSHTRARTGIQRVVRSLQTALGTAAVSITYDPYLGAWRELRKWEQANLAATMPARHRGAQWPLGARIFSRFRRYLGASATTLPTHAAGTILPEIFSPTIAASMATLPRPRVAVFHDAIALRLPEMTPQKTVARFPAYLRELLSLDGIAAVSDDSRDALLEYWRWLGITGEPPVQTIPLGIDVMARSADTGGLLDDAHRPTGTPAASSLVVLSVGSIEGRKNHIALLDACEQLWTRGRTFDLHLVGMARSETAQPALTMIDALRSKGRPLRHDTAADDDALSRAYQSCSFTVYPSLMEGFGLPVLESLAYRKPCICSNRGALGEAARGGGCIGLDRVDANGLAEAIDRLLSDANERARLEQETRRRTFRTWHEYARDLTDWMRMLQPR
jgi:glycosyltransferase involved in cell wall biosynthesis